MIVLALTTAATVVLAIALAVVVIWAFVFAALMRDRRAGVPVPPNLKPYLEDDALETRVLSRALQWAVGSVLALGLMMGAIFVWEPTREADAFKDLEEKAVEQGELIYGSARPDAEGHTTVGAFGCADCHGPGGTGGAAVYTITEADGTQRKVTWSAPPLDDIFFRYSEEEVRGVIMFGRPGTPMPPWSVDGGGSMTAQQVEDTLAYLESIQISKDEAKNENAEVGLVGRDANGDPQYDGAELFDQFCARCHTAGFSYGEPGLPGNGALGPNLRGGDSRIRFPALENQVEFITQGSKFEVPFGNQGLGTGRMPGFGMLLSPEQILAVILYERDEIDNDMRTGKIVGDTTGTSEQDVTEDVPGDVSKAEEQQQQLDVESD